MGVDVLAGSSIASGRRSAALGVADAGEALCALGRARREPGEEARNMTRSDWLAVFVTVALIGLILFLGYGLMAEVR